MKCERALSKLTLSDQEQRELYEAAQIIQKAYRSYKGRKKADDQQDKEAKAAIVIQNYYRRYKEVLIIANLLIVPIFQSNVVVKDQKNFNSHLVNFDVYFFSICTGSRWQRQRLLSRTSTERIASTNALRSLTRPPPASRTITELTKSTKEETQDRVGNQRPLLDLSEF